MTAATGERGGGIDLRGDRPRGLPLLKPLYGPGPYQYTNGMVLIIVYDAEDAAISEVLPRELQPLGATISMTFFVWPEVTGIGPHSFAMPLVPARLGDLDGQWVPYLYTSTDASLACYRECQGWPAVLGTAELTHARGQVRARVLRAGREVVRATAEVGGEPVTALDFLPIILYKEIPNLDGSGRDVGYFLTSTSKLTNLDFRAGSGTLTFPDPGDDPVARLRPVRVHQALFGSLDDLYPETIRRLDPLEAPR